MGRIGIDIGGTKIESVLLRDDFTEIRRMRIPTPFSYNDIVKSVAEMICDAGSDSEHVGVCAPGSISEGVLVQSNCAALRGRALRADIEDLLGRDIRFENDANCFALAEARMGAARGYETVFGAILGTGVGGGVITDGGIFRGANGIAGEWGHHVLHPGGRECHCGRRGCAEQYLSGPALETRWRELGGEPLPLHEIARRAEPDGTWRREFLECLARGLCNVAAVLDPDVIVLGGGVSNLGFIYECIADYMSRDSPGCRVRILKNGLGDSAGVIGACLLK